MDGAPHRRIEQRRSEPSVNDTNRVVMVLGGFDGKDCPPFAQFSDVEVHQRTYWGPRQFARDDLLQVLKTR